MYVSSLCVFLVILAKAGGARFHLILVVQVSSPPGLGISVLGLEANVARAIEQLKLFLEDPQGCMAAIVC